MEFSKNAQKLFDAYQKDGRINNLRDSLDMLDEIIESQGTDSHRAINFKKVIGRHIDTKLNEIYFKSNVEEFGKALKDGELGSILFEALGAEDLRRLGALISVRRDYFTQTEYVSIQNGATLQQTEQEALRNDKRYKRAAQ